MMAQENDMMKPRTHHAHGLLQAAALLVHDLHDDALHEHPEGEGHDEGLETTSGEETKVTIQKNEQRPEYPCGHQDLAKLPFRLGGLSPALPQQQLDLECELLGEGLGFDVYLGVLGHLSRNL
jgi:hypothetical protein